MQNDVIAYLRTTRMISVHNLANAMNKAPSEIFPVLDVLQQQGVLRMGGSVCRSSCTQCATNSCDVPRTTWTPESIVISLIAEVTR